MSSKSGIDSHTRVKFLILNWNNPNDTLFCIQSLLDAGIALGSIILIDNGSIDDSANIIRQTFSDIQIIETGENLGYAGGNNLGIELALKQGAEYICVLNNDLVVSANFLLPLISILDDNNEIGVTTPLVANLPDDGRVWTLGADIDGYSGDVTRIAAGENLEMWKEKQPFVVDCATGAALVVKSEVFEECGLFDETFFLYYEEIDWCLRIRKFGYLVYAVPSSVVWHKTSSTLGTTSPIIDYYMLRNHLRLIGRHWPVIMRLPVISRIILRNLINIVAFSIKSHGGQRVPNRNARIFALRDAALGRSGRISDEVANQWGMF